MTDEQGKTEKPPSDDWKRQPSGLYLPPGVPEGGKKQPVGFARALQEKRES